MQVQRLSLKDKHKTPFYIAVFFAKPRNTVVAASFIIQAIIDIQLVKQMAVALAYSSI